MEIPLNQILKALDSSIDKLDQTRAADLMELSLARSARFAGLARDRARLVEKLGETHPRVVALDRDIALHKEVLNGYAAESAASSAKLPKVDARSWALYGNVVDGTRRPLEGVTVALYHGDVWDQRAGYSCTDSSGRFVLQVADAAKMETRLSLHVLKDRKTIHVDPQPVTIQPAHAEYREVVLASQEASTCEPPSGVRKDPPSTNAPAPRTTRKRPKK
jgi:hypothetical protein